MTTSLLALLSDTILSAETAETEWSQQVIIKADDVGNRGPKIEPKWQRFVDYIEEADIQASIGLVTDSLEDGSEDYYQWIRDLHESGRIEFWHHGYDHSRDRENKKPTWWEFRDRDYEAQKFHFARGMELAKEKLGITFRTFGAPYNATDSTTARVLEEDPEMRIWLYPGDLSRSSKLPLHRIGALNIEKPVGVINFDPFAENYPDHADEAVLVLQCHPGNWDERSWSEFKKIVEFLKAKGATFTTPSAYFQIEEGKKGASPMTSENERSYKLWEPNPAPNRGANDVKKPGDGFPYDKDWENWSYPIGNGHMGANLFGRFDTERIQITEKTLHNEGVYGRGGLTSFGEIYLDFNHTGVSNYRRSLNLNEGVAHVGYESKGVRFTREYFMSYPDEVLVVRLEADTDAALSFRLRPEIAYLDREDRTGKVTASGDTITLSGHMPFLDINFEAQIKVLHEGGSLKTTNPPSGGQIEVSDADSVTLIFAADSNYELNTQVFLPYPENKLDPKAFPHDAVSAKIANAANKGFAGLRATHLEDYQNLFGRVNLKLNSEPSPLPTHELLANYKAGQTDNWLEELMFQYGRYLLIASSRETSLPANLQGTWNQYYYTPWTGGYWHNINVQMNYWGAFSANLAETFLAYVRFYEAYLPLAENQATEYVRKFRPEKLSEGPGSNGWIIGSGANNYYLPTAAAGHSGPGTGGMTAKLFMEYFEFTQDRDYLESIAYPALRSMSRFFSKSLQPQDDGTLLVYPSASPEIKVLDPARLEKLENTGEIIQRNYYRTTGCTFDQWSVWEVYDDMLTAADVLGQQDPFVETIKDQITRLAPILIGASGQIKEFREEIHYADIGDPKHRHISHLCALYPGSLIDDAHTDWQAAASKTLDFRGNDTTGWAMAHRMNARARLGEGVAAHKVYQKLIAGKTAPNLWTLHPPFQIDASLGLIAGVAEMLLQSHEGTIEPLPALPEAWDEGHFDGLVARGNFVLSVKWTEGKATRMTVTARAGGECRIRYPGIEAARIVDAQGQAVESTSPQSGQIHFGTTQGESYHITL